MRIAALFLVAFASGCPAPPQACDVARFRDAEETPAEASAGDSCHRAGARIAKVCPSMWRPDWDTWCHHMVEHDFPICPNRLARVHSCEEADQVCR